MTTPTHNGQTANDILSAAFSEVGKKYGYDNCTAEYTATRDFKVKWQRTYRWADFKVSDYLIDAPYEVLSSLAETLFKKISGQETSYSDEMREYVKSDEFVAKHQPIYIRRTKKITHDAQGEFKSLTDSFDRLKGMGLVEDAPQMYLTWTKENLYRQVGYSSALMQVVVISSSFDDANVPDFVLDFVVYHQFLTMSMGKAHFGDHDWDVETEERKFPQYADALRFLSRMNLCL